MELGGRINPKWIMAGYYSTGCSGSAISSFSKAAAGRLQTKTCRILVRPVARASVLECASPLALCPILSDSQVVYRDA